MMSGIHLLFSFFVACHPPRPSDYGAECDPQADDSCSGQMVCVFRDEGTHARFEPGYRCSLPCEDHIECPHTECPRLGVSEYTTCDTSAGYCGLDCP